MFKFVLSTAFAVCLAMPALAQLEPTPEQMAEQQMLEKQLSPNTVPIPTSMKLVEQSPVTTLVGCKQLIAQRMDAQRVRYDADNFNEDPNNIVGPFKAYVFIGNTMFNFNCEWAQQPCLTTQKPTDGLEKFPRCDTNKIIMKAYKEG